MEGNDKTPTFKVVGLITGVFVMLSMFIGGTMWISMSITSNNAAIDALGKALARNEALVMKNSEIIHQHDRLLVVLEQHSKQLETLTDLITDNRSYVSAVEGERHEKRLDAIEEWMAKAPPAWFREMFNEFKTTVSDRLEKVDKLLNVQCIKLDELERQMRNHLEERK